MKKLLIIIGAILVVFVLFGFSLYWLHLSHVEPLGGTPATQVQSHPK